MNETINTLTETINTLKEQAQARIEERSQAWEKLLARESQTLFANDLLLSDVLVYRNDDNSLSFRMSVSIPTQHGVNKIGVIAKDKEGFHVDLSWASTSVSTDLEDKFNGYSDYIKRVQVAFEWAHKIVFSSYKESHQSSLVTTAECFEALYKQYPIDSLQQQIDALETIVKNMKTETDKDKALEYFADRKYFKTSFALTSRTDIYNAVVYQTKKDRYVVEYLSGELVEKRHVGIETVLRMYHFATIPRTTRDYDAVKRSYVYFQIPPIGCPTKEQVMKTYTDAEVKEITKEEYVKLRSVASQHGM